MQIKSNFKGHLYNLMHILDLHLSRSILPNAIDIILLIKTDNIWIIHGEHLGVTHINHPLIIYQTIKPIIYLAEETEKRESGHVEGGEGGDVLGGQVDFVGSGY